MDYVEIVLKDINIEQIQDVLYKFLIFDEKNIISSHFYNQEKNKDASYQEIGNLKNYFRTPGTCSISLKKAIIGTELNNVLIHIACDERYGDITISFEDDQIKEYHNKEIVSKVQSLMTYVIRIYKSGEVGGIIMGYEPAEDEDMKMIEISQNKITIFNENVFESPVTTMIYSIAKDLNI